MKKIRKNLTVFFLSVAIAALVCPWGISRAQAAEPSKSGERLKLTFTSPVGEFYYEDVLIQPTDYLVADEIHTRKINTSMGEKRAFIMRAVRAGSTYERAVTSCMPRVKQTVDEAERALKIVPKDAEMEFRAGYRPPFKIKKEIIGRELDREKTFELVYAALCKGGQVSMGLPTVDIPPEVTAKQLAATTYLKSDFQTRYEGSGEDRQHNIALALSKINGRKIMPGEEFSFNSAVGARTKENGFKEAKIILDGDYVLGYGGGVCQASTTLYNAALRAGMQITMVRNHSLPSSYVEPSLDAMVNSGSSDLRFKNPLSTPIYIAASASHGVARVRIYGEKNEYSIVPRSVVLKRTPAPVEKTVVDSEHKYFPEEAMSGERMTVRLGKEGIKSEAYLEYYKQGRLVRREKIRTDSYKSLPPLVAIAP